MMQRFEVVGVHGKLDDGLRRYAAKKLAGLDVYLPKHARQSAHMEIRLIAERLGGRRQTVCEIVLHVPRQVISLTEAGANGYEAIDMAEAALKRRIRRYKEELTNGKQRRHLFIRLQRRWPLEMLAS